MISQQDAQLIHIAVSEEELLNEVLSSRDFSDSASSPSPVLKQLHAQLVAPLVDYLHTPLVGIVPHVLLHYVPFAALSDANQYFGDAFTLFELPSAGVLAYLQVKPATAIEPLVMAYAHPAGLQVLREANAEARAVADAFGTTPLADDAAAESTFKERAGQFAIVHVVAHGELNGPNPQFSRLMLAPDGANDGPLKVHEVYGLNLSRTQLVVLSACQTQLGQQSSGDDVVGLTRAFQYAGAPTVVASPWNVDDAGRRLRGHSAWAWPGVEG